MHIAFLTNEYPPWSPGGGIGTSVRTLALALARQGHRVTVVGWGRAMTLEDDGVHIRFLEATRVPRGGWLLNRRAAATELTRLVRDEGLDIVEAPEWTGLSALMRVPCPIVLRCNGSAGYFAHLTGARTRASVRWAEGLALRRCAGIAAVSRYTGELTARLFHLRRPIEVIPNGIDPQPWADVPEDDDGDAAEREILYFGTIIRKKGVLDLCEAFSVVVRNRPTARLRLIGRDERDSGTGSPSTWALCEALLSPEARARTVYQGPIPHSQLPSAIRRAAFCVLPSYAEACPLAWLEAMAGGKATIVYDGGWVPEMAECGVSALFVRTGDRRALAHQMTCLLDDDAGARRMGAAARAHVLATFSADVVARTSAGWYRRILAGGSAEKTA